MSWVCVEPVTNPTDSGCGFLDPSLTGKVVGLNWSNNYQMSIRSVQIGIRRARLSNCKNYLNPT